MTDQPPERGAPVGFISIPQIGADFYIVEGVELRWLQEGPGHFPQTPMPGQAGNAALAGHRTTFKAPFNRIDELVPGDQMTVVTLQGTFTYEVLPQPSENGEPPSGHYIVGPYATEILDDKGDNRITLMACHPKYSAAQRIVVEAKLVGNPVPSTPRSDEPTAIDELAGGDDSARAAAIFFSVAAIALWFGVWLFAHFFRRWKWPAYLIALPFFAVLLFFAFDSINQLLPAAY
jgi:sortase A